MTSWRVSEKGCQKSTKQQRKNNRCKLKWQYETKDSGEGKADSVLDQQGDTVRSGSDAWWRRSCFSSFPMSADRSRGGRRARKDRGASFSAMSSSFFFSSPSLLHCFSAVFMHGTQKVDLLVTVATFHGKLLARAIEIWIYSTLCSKRTIYPAIMWLPAEHEQDWWRRRPPAAARRQAW